MIVCFVDIGGIVDHHCLNLSFHNSDVSVLHIINILNIIYANGFTLEAHNNGFLRNGWYQKDIQTMILNPEYCNVKTGCLINKHINATDYKHRNMFISLTPNKHV